MLTDDSVCYKHDGRSAAVSCQRCDKPICTSCMNQASVGHHCPDCTSEGSQKVYRGLNSVVSAQDFIITKILVVVNVGIFALQYFNPELKIDERFLLFGPLVAEGEWWRIITSGFVHVGVLHIAFNAYAIWVLGQALEQVVGKLRFLLIYLGGLLGASLFVLLLNYLVPTLGASGAVMGIAGGLAVYMRSRGQSVFGSQVMTLIIFNILLPIAIPGISFAGHLGGVVGGAIVGSILFNSFSRKRSNEQDRKELLLILAAIACVAMFLGCFYIGISGSPAVA